MADARPQPLAMEFAETPVHVAPEVPRGTDTVPLSEVVDTLQTTGRVAGFEQLRDALLTNWRSLAGMGVPLTQIIKMVLETDRHALFALLSEEKLGDRDTQKQKSLENFQEYLQGKTDIPVLGLDTKKELPAGEVEATDG